LLNDVKIDRDDAQYREGREEKREDKKKKTDLHVFFFHFFWQNCTQTHNILFKPTEPLAKNTKKIQKNVPARARYIIRILSAPRNNVGTIQRVSCHPGTPRMLEY
jgi:hypothetical protein